MFAVCLSVCLYVCLSICLFRTLLLRHYTKRIWLNYSAETGVGFCGLGSRFQGSGNLEMEVPSGVQRQSHGGDLGQKPSEVKFKL